ncbi:MAG: hypothetical protein WCS03_05265 [Bacteroidota bacterium]
MKKNYYLFVALLAGVIFFTQCKKETLVEKTTISGIIVNSQNGLGLTNATISFCKPFDHGLTATPEVVFVVTTNSTGQYTTDQAIVGTYTIMIQAVNFFTLYIDNFVVATGLGSTFDPITLVQTLSGAVLRIVLTWGETPSDLDSHLTGPTADPLTRFHVYFSVDSYNPANATTPIVNLDVDNTTNFGPETTTINIWQVGTYRYSIFNYSDQSSSGGAGIKSSPAAVKVYGTTGLLKSYSPPTFPASGGNTWVVFEITVTDNTYTITDKNTWINSTNSGAVTKK